MSDFKVVILAGNGDSTAILFNDLKKSHQIEALIIEDSPSKSKLLKRRIKRLGLFKVLSQILFIFYSKFLRKLSKKRIQEIIQSNSFNTSLAESNYKKVSSVNSDECITLLQEIGPSLIIVNGTRIISKKVLDHVNTPFINIHVGITPKYRGVHGAYWALVNNDEENCGITVHRIDEGIDTGGILYQEKVLPSKDDNFTTYPYLQYGTGVKLVCQAVEDAKSGSLKTISNELPSQIWSHPGFFEYMKNYLKLGVK